MRNRFLTFVVLWAATFANAQVPRSNHMVVVVLENRHYSEIVGNTGSMPYLNSLIQKYGLATNYYANTHPSIGNYFMMTTGQVVTNDDAYTATVTVDNLARRFIADGRTWREYAESRPAQGWIGGDYDGVYVQHHSPFSYFSDVRNSTTQRQNLYSMSQFRADVANRTLPAFSFVVPNNQHNTHDGTLATADDWLRSNIDPIFATPYFQAGGDGILVILFDESDGSDSAFGGGHIATVVAGPTVKPGYRSTTFYQHQSLLKTIGKALALTSIPGAGATAPDMGEFFTSSAPPPCQ
jgi:phosphatidylinositol-3-phosphatase